MDNASKEKPQNLRLPWCITHAMTMTMLDSVTPLIPSFIKLALATGAKTQLIMGADVNARLGTRECADDAEVIGSHGIDQSNEQGQHLLMLYSTHQLLIENTFFEHDHYAPYVSLPSTEKKACMTSQCSLRVSFDLILTSISSKNAVHGK